MDTDYQHQINRATPTSEKELFNEIVDLLARCRSSGIVLFEQKEEASRLIKAAHRLDYSSVELQKATSKLEKAIGQMISSPFSLKNGADKELLSLGSIKMILLNRYFDDDEQKSFFLHFLFCLEPSKYCSQYPEDCPRAIEIQKDVEWVRSHRPSSVYEALQAYIHACLAPLTNREEEILVPLTSSMLRSLTKEVIQNDLDARVESMKSAMRSSKKKKEIAIIGGGPAGLIRALYSISLGYTSRILEKRDGIYLHNRGRPNVLHLGHEDETDLEILIRFGVLQKALLNERLIESEYGGFQIAICDLEKSILEVILEIDADAFIPNVTTLQIQPNDEGKTVLSYQATTLNPDLIFICDGGHSLTAKKFGLLDIPLTKKVHAPIGFFTHDPSSSLPLQTIVGLMGVAQSAISHLVNRASLSEMKNRLVTKGVLLRNASEDYVGISLSEEEEKALAQLQGDAKKKWLREKLTQRQRELDLLMAMFKDTHSIRPARLQEAKIISIRVKRVATSAFSIGKTLYLVRGDAHGTTHPASGYGAKTALASLIAEEQLLPHFEELGANPFAIATFNLQAESHLLRSQSRGLSAMRSYRSHFKKPNFHHFLSEPGGLAYRTQIEELQTYQEIQKWRPFSEKEIDILLTIRKKVIKSHFEGLPISEEEHIPTLKKHEEQIFGQVATKLEAIEAKAPFTIARAETLELLAEGAEKIGFDFDATLFRLLAQIERLLVA